MFQNLKVVVAVIWRSAPLTLTQNPAPFRNRIPDLSLDKAMLQDVLAKKS